MEIEYHTATGKTKLEKVTEVPDHLAHSLGKVTVQGGKYVEEGIEDAIEEAGDIVEGVASEIGKVSSSFISGLGVWNLLLIGLLVGLTLILGVKFLL